MRFVSLSIVLVSLFFMFGCDELGLKSGSLFKISEKEKAEALGSSDTGPILIKGAKVYTVAGKTFAKANILLKDGKIHAVSEKEISVSEGVRVIDGEGLQVTPGLIDVHSHMGVYPRPGLKAHMDGNEATKSATPQVNVKDSFWPEDPSIWRALEGGVTTIQVLPGSANLIGGESFTAKLDPKTTAEEMRFKEAPQGIKMACGENPKRVYGEKGGPSTRMGNAAGFRALFQKAKEAIDSKKIFKKKEEEGEAGKTDFAVESLKRVLKGETLVHIHCYRADDLSTMMTIAKEYGFKIRTFHHGLEAYKLKDILAKENIAVATWADWWGFKAEAYDGIPHNIALLQEAGGRPIVHSDSEVDIRFLNIEAAKAWRSGLELGLDTSEEEALSWITLNPAWALGVDKMVGTIEEGKHADLVVWDGHPFSAKTKSKFVIVNGKIVLDRDQNIRPLSDFEVGYRKENFYDGRGYTKVLTEDQILKPNFDQKLFSETFEIDDSFILAKVKFSPNSQEYFDVEVKDGLISRISLSKPGSKKSKAMLLTPGLIETVSTLGLFEIGMEKSTNDRYQHSDENFVDLRTKDSLNLKSSRIAISRKEGVTTNFSYVMSGGDIESVGVGFDLHEDAKVIENAPILTVLSKNGWSDKFSSRSRKWWSLRKLASETFNYSKGSVSKFDKSLLVKEADYKRLLPYFKGEKVWIFAAEKLQDMKSILSFKKEMKKLYGFNIMPVIQGGAESWLMAKELSKAGIPVILKPTEQTPDNFDKLRAREDIASYLLSKDVEVILTAGATNDAAVRRLRQEMGFAMKYGMSWAQGLKSITETPARVFGLNDRGVIKVGAKANLVLWAGDLSNPMSTPLKVWIDGKRKSLKDRQRMLAEKYK